MTDLQTNQDPLSLLAVEKFASSIFAVGEPSVLETYSEYEAEVRRFTNAEQVCELARVLATQHGGAISLALHFPDAGGAVSIRKNALDPRKTGGATYRYCVEGWGLISAHLAVGQPVGVRSSVTALSQKRALAFEGIRLGLGPPWQEHSSVEAWKDGESLVANAGVNDGLICPSRLHWKAFLAIIEQERGYQPDRPSADPGRPDPSA